MAMKTQRKNKPGAGRPTVFTQSVMDEIVDRIASGESCNAIGDDPSMPDGASIYRQLGRDDNFASNCARARLQQADVMDDLVLDTAKACTPETAASSRVQIDAYKWRAARLAPHKYGDKVAVAISGSLDLRNLTDAELDAELADRQ